MILSKSIFKNIRLFDPKINSVRVMLQSIKQLPIIFKKIVVVAVVVVYLHFYLERNDLAYNS